MSENISKNIDLRFKLKNIEILKTQINTAQPEFKANEFQFTIHLETKIEPADKLILIGVNADIKADNKPELLGSFGAACSFEIENFAEIFFKTSENAYNIPNDVIVTLISLSISTLRGIMFDQLRGTYLHNAFLPILDPKEFKLQNN